MVVKAWTNGMHSTVHASAHPDCAVTNAFGDTFITSLCPANPDVRAYVRALAGDLGRYPLEAIWRKASASCRSTMAITTSERWCRSVRP